MNVTSRCLRGNASRIAKPLQNHPQSRQGILFKSRVRHAPLQVRFTTADQLKPAGERPAIYPEWLLVFHAGTLRTVFVGWLKVTTIFVFLSFGVGGAITVWRKRSFKPLTIAAVVASVLPMLFVYRVTRPFAASVHLRLPAFARQSKPQLTRYCNNLPPSAEINITTLNSVGLPRKNQVYVSQLSLLPKRTLSIANYGRPTKGLNDFKPRMAPKAMREFAIRGGTGKLKEGWVWEALKKKIERDTVYVDDRVMHNER